MMENRMELFIETLTGTAFELSCSPLETIVSIKAKIQFSEGIPVSQQHLIWKSQELNDDLCLQDYSITDGATIKLVLGMRGGPINTRQVADTKKLKDIAEYVERNSEAGSSGGRPLTVLVFHDGDKVHMYTLMEKGDSTVSPLSGTISETSSVASIKNVDEIDQELVRENEITREKIAQLQEQLRALSLNKPKKVTSQRKPTSKKLEHFHLPPLQRVDAINSEPTQYSYQDIPLLNHKSTTNANKNNSSDNSHAALNLISNNVSTYILSSPDKSSLGLNSGSSFLPYISSSSINGASKDLVTMSMHRSSSQDSILYSVAQKAHKHLPLTSSQALSTQKYIDLDVWLRNRPKTTPSSFKNSSGDRRPGKAIRGKRRLRNSIKNSVPTGEKSSLLMQVFDNHILTDSKPSISIKSKVTNSSYSNKPGIGMLVASSLKAFKESSPDTSQIHNEPNLKISPPKKEEISRPHSGKRLPLIKSKKKCKRCALCSKKTGLATSYTCRCGKNFCASHRYAEVHHCTYDYKTEGRRLLQLNNPLITASKLPKI